ncbi:MAG: c-type cytochrome [Cyanobacteria bacterium J06635_1]
MKYVFSAIAVLMTVASLMVASPAFAADLAEGAQVFSGNCAACHAGGRNVVNAAKTLQKSDLDQYDMASIEAIKAQVTNGKNAMPAFAGRLTPEQIESVAAYVLDQSEKGW